MKKALTIAATFIFFYVGMSALLYLMNVNTITEILIISLLAAVAWHIMFYIVMPRLRKNDKA